ncbi:sialidase family protein [Sinomicrobium weinanense]|uniref:exo-alpha-sialidase n=1 Tax=Sinomicrobium weinanense TaxID=2842200 RepID=A0A926JTX5_9FLAO|nr:sialidase family protein [Sinomicrobium weinanense]MBC9797121.1 exo-alpha-sialidase [Sinomicrobium weinanense]MBU3124822.1 glycoside hydrolase [Sinomicrobium weinanense]
MKTKRIICLLYSCLAILCSLTACGSDDSGPEIKDPVDQPDDDTPPEDDGRTLVYEEGTNGYQVYRIPAMAKTTEGTLLAFAEARKLKSNGDSGDIDLVVKSSPDNGKTWSEMQIIWDEGQNTCGNPVPIIDIETGRIHLLMTWNHGDDDWGDLSSGTGVDTRRVYYTWSDDDGKSWTSPVEITSSVKDESWDWYGTGPVHGIQLQKGEHKGRLVSPNYFTTRRNGKAETYSHIIYSDDHGATWKSGDPAPKAQAGECTVAELEDGSLLLNIRTSSVKARQISRSSDGGMTWSEQETVYALTDPHCQGSMVTSDTDPYRLFFANASSTERVNMTLKMSENNGESWNRQKLIYSGPSAYSDLVMLSDTEVGILYEGGEGRPYESIVFEIVSVEDLK